jgi:hypothetical protein
MKQILFFFTYLLLSFGTFAQKKVAFVDDWKGSVPPLNNVANRLIVDTFLLNNIEDDDTFAAYFTTTPPDYLLGHNSFGDKGWAERYDIQPGDSVKIIGIASYIRGAVRTTSTTKATFKVYDAQRLQYNNPNGGTFSDYTLLPGTTLATVQQNYKDINYTKRTDNEIKLNEVYFSAPIIVKDSFFVSFELANYTSFLDTLGLFSTRDGNRSTDTLLTQNCAKWSDNKWYDEYFQNFGLLVNYAIFPIIEITSCTPVAASVSIATTTTTVCASTNVTFTATPTNGGPAPSYQWKLNGNNVGTNSATYSNNALANGNTVTCVMTSNADCVTGSPATSNTITMTVNPSVAASVNIAPTATNICAGTNVTFTATPTNGGTTPSYQWKLNGVNVGTNSPTYSNNALTNLVPVTCVMTSNAACVTGSPATSNSVAIVVNPSVAASVSIAPTATNVCAGTNVIFTATPTNGGAAPSYLWKLNGNNVGTNSSTYSNNTLANGNTVSCVMTSNAACVTGSPATSNTITMTVNPSVAASVSIAPTATNVCAGTNVIFTATPTNGGAAPSYQWKLNGNNVGTNSSTYSNNALANGNLVSCVMTSNAACVTGSPATSNTINMTVNTNLTPTVAISANANPICPGTNVTFTATPSNGGTTPSYQWKLNGNNVGTNSATYSNAALATGNTVSCVMTSNASCLTSSTATSNVITMQVTANPPASVTIAPTATNICAGTNVTFTATPINGGTPSYQWKLNGNNVGTNSATYSNNALTNGNTVTCIMTSSLSCVTGSPATSNTITMTVNPNVAASVSIVPTATNVCSGTNVTFTATPTNGGTTPSYQWKLNGANVGTNSATYSNNGLANLVPVTCVMTSNAACVTGSPATSNTINMTVNPNPVPIISQTVNNLNSSAAASYQWNLNGNPIALNGTSQQYTALVNGNYSVTVVDANGCTGTSAVLNVTVSGIFQPVQFQKIEIFPNPNNGLMKMVIETPKGGEITLQIIDILGKLVSEKIVNINQGRNEFALDLSELSQNIYFIKTKLNDLNYQGKIIIAE